MVSVFGNADYNEAVGNGEPCFSKRLLRHVEALFDHRGG